MDRIFVNRVLNMKKIKYIGLDMDHTLIRYHTERFEHTVYTMVIERLIRDMHYPEAIRQFTFNMDIAMRGLVVDCRHGNLLKLSRFAAIRQSRHGMQAIPFHKQKEIYGGIYIDLSAPDYIVIDTAFSIAFCCLYAQLVDYKDQHPELLPEYVELARHALYMVDTIHADGSLKKYIAEHITHYVIQDKSIVSGLQRYIQYGKKIFILTNSDYHYTKTLLDYAINPFLEPGTHWHQLFDYVITLANKPRFFYDNLRYLRVNPEDGSLHNHYGALTPGIYQGGNARTFTQDLHRSGEEILYIGDHVYGDVVRLKKECNWRTALVVEELGTERAGQAHALPLENKITTLMQQKEETETRYVALNSARIEHHQHDHDQEIRTAQEAIHALDNQIAECITKKQQYFNPYWDRVFRVGAEESFFASQVNRYACIYMEKLCDLLQESPMRYYRAFYRALPHE